MSRVREEGQKNRTGILKAMINVRYLSTHNSCDSQSTCSSDRISPVAVPSAKMFRFQLFPGHIRFAATNLIVKKSIADVFYNIGHGQNIVLRFLIAPDVDAIV